jgi:hypothetical protein
MSAEWEAVTKDWVDREREVVLTAAMKHLAKSLREVTTPPRNGASLGAILNAAEFDSVLQEADTRILDPRQAPQRARRITNGSLAQRRARAELDRGCFCLLRCPGYSRLPRRGSQ